MPFWSDKTQVEFIWIFIILIYFYQWNILIFCFGCLGTTPVCICLLSLGWTTLFSFSFSMLLFPIFPCLSLVLVSFYFQPQPHSCLSFGTDFGFSTPSFRAFSPFSILSHSLSPWQVSEFLVLALVLAGRQPILGAHWQPLKALSAWKMLQEEDGGRARERGGKKGRDLS